MNIGGNKIGIQFSMGTAEQQTSATFAALNTNTKDDTNTDQVQVYPSPSFSQESQLTVQDRVVPSQQSHDEEDCSQFNQAPADLLNLLSAPFVAPN